MKIRPYQICVSGAAAGETVETSSQLAFDLGRAVASKGHTLLTGATIGLPYHAALGAKAENGLSVGFSPANSYREHVHTYKLPTDAFDFINFTGMDYVGRDVYLVRSAEAVITVGGRMGSMHEFSSALESHKVCGVLLGSGGLADFIPAVLDKLPSPGGGKVVYDTDPHRLVVEIIKTLDHHYRNFDDPTNELKEYAKAPQTDREG